MLSRKMSTTIKNLDKSNNTKDLKYLAFKEWLAGLIDGDGYFLFMLRRKMDTIVVR